MLRLAIGVMTVAVIGAALAGCSPTRHRPTAGPGGQIHTRINCRSRSPHKCTKRAEDVCGSYTIIEPLHVSAEDPVESTMVVHCNPPNVPPAAAATSSAAGIPMNAQPVVSPAGDGGA